jgi:LPS O-antigen subunit length determinant protein (WzzB/FepE family)
VIQGRDNLGHEPFDDDQIAKIERKRRISQISTALDLAETAQQRRPQNRRRDPHLIDTPKHFAAMAASKKTAALGKVNCDTA